MVAAIKTGVESVAELVSVCSDSNYNLPAINLGRRIQKAAAFNVWLIDDECREHSIIF